MGYTHGTSKDALTRVCTRCGKEYPNTKEYFRSCGKKGLDSRCKECYKQLREKRNENLGNVERTLFYDGTKQCPKCKRDLPNNYYYFPTDKGCVSGLRNVCRECSKKCKGFLEEGYVPLEHWSEEDKELMRLYYKDYTCEQLQKTFFPNRSVHAIDSQALLMGIAGKSEIGMQKVHQQQSEKLTGMFLGRVMSEETKQKLSQSIRKYYETHDGAWLGRKRTPEQCKQISERMKGNWVGDKNPRHLNPLEGSTNGRWKGGIKSLKDYMRDQISEWQNNSMAFCKYRSVITGQYFKHIHHTTSFTYLLDMAVQNTNLDYRSSIGQYANKELELITKELQRLHWVYGLGACIEQEIHKLFHDIYSYITFTPYDFLEFLHDIDNGKYNEWFESRSIVINLNREYLSYLETLCDSLRSVA